MFLVVYLKIKKVSCHKPTSVIDFRKKIENIAIFMFVCISVVISNTRKAVTDIQLRFDGHNEIHCMMIFIYHIRSKREYIKNYPAGVRVFEGQLG